MYSSLLMLSLFVDPIDSIDKYDAYFGKLLYMLIVWLSQLERDKNSL